MVWGTLRVLRSRYVPVELEFRYSWEGDFWREREEDLWTFGQLLPVLLLLGPSYHIISLLTKMKQDDSGRPFRTAERQTSVTHEDRARNSSENSGSGQTLSGSTIASVIGAPPNASLSPSLETLRETYLMSRKYYFVAVWRVQCYVLLGLNTVVTAAWYLAAMSYGSTSTLAGFWLGIFGLAVNFIFPSFGGSFTLILLGLEINQEKEQAAHRQEKLVLAFLLGLLIQVFHWVLVYCLMGFDIDEDMLALFYYVLAYWGGAFGLYLSACAIYCFYRTFW